MTLGQIRKRRAMSARELAEKAGVTSTSVTRIEGGSVPRYSTIRKLSEALGLRPEDILWPGDPLGLNDDISLPQPQKEQKEGE
jgi:transcriptional regulator with XRE-family HTH domain